MTSDKNEAIRVDIQLVREMVAQIQQTKDILIAVATGGPRIQDKEAEYTSLYQAIDSNFQYLQSVGIDVANPNSFRSLWDWYGHWSTNLPSYQDRRAYIRHLYDDILIPLEIALNQGEGTPEISHDLSRSVRIGVYKQTMGTSSRIPTEIHDSIGRFQLDHPDPLKAAFIMMQFGRSEAHHTITAAIRSALAPYQIEGLRADDKQYHDDLFPNILTYMYGCGFGIAIFERIETDEFNPNVSLELGYMLALNKSVCLLKDKSIKTLQADLVGKLYRLFDTYDIDNTIGFELSRWLLDKRIVS